MARVASRECLAKVSRGKLLLVVPGARPSQGPRVYRIPLKEIDRYDLARAEVAGQRLSCAVCEDSGLCSACGGTGKNRFGLPCLWCTPGLTKSSWRSGRCSFCPGVSADDRAAAKLRTRSDPRG